MKNLTKGLLAVVTAAGLLLQNPAAQAAIGAFLHSHPNASAIVLSLGGIFALIHDPKQSS